MKVKEFIKKYADACGGNWVMMLQTAIENYNNEIATKVITEDYENEHDGVFQFTYLGDMINNICQNRDVISYSEWKAKLK